MGKLGPGVVALEAYLSEADREVLKASAKVEGYDSANQLLGALGSTYAENRRVRGPEAKFARFARFGGPSEPMPEAVLAASLLEQLEEIEADVLAPDFHPKFRYGFGVYRELLRLRIEDWDMVKQEDWNRWEKTRFVPPEHELARFRPGGKPETTSEYEAGWRYAQGIAWGLWTAVKGLLENDYTDVELPSSKGTVTRADVTGLLVLVDDGDEVPGMEELRRGRIIRRRRY